MDDRLKSLEDIEEWEKTYRQHIKFYTVSFGNRRGIAQMMPPDDCHCDRTQYSLYYKTCSKAQARWTPR